MKPTTINGITLGLNLGLAKEVQVEIPKWICKFCGHWQCNFSPVCEKCGKVQL